MIQVVMGAVALMIVGMVVLIFSVVATWSAGLIAGVALAVVLGVLARPGPDGPRPTVSRRLQV